MQIELRSTTFGVFEALAANVTTRLPPMMMYIRLYTGTEFSTTVFITQIHGKASLLESNLFSKAKTKGKEQFYFCALDYAWEMKPH